MRALRNIFLILVISTGSWFLLAQASNIPFNQNTNLRIGIGTTMAANAGLTVMSGNVGIGTWNPQALLDVSTGGGSPVVLRGNGPGK